MVEIIQSEKGRFRWFLIVLTAGLTGYHALPSSIDLARMKASAPVAVQKPVHMEQTTARTSLPLPSGSIVELGPGNGPKITLSAPAAVETETITKKADTATGYAPPSPIEKAKASGVRLFWIASLGAFLAAGLLAWRAHFLAAVCAAGAAVALPVLANVVNSQAAMITFAALAASAAGIFSAWHIEHLKQKEKNASST